MRLRHLLIAVLLFAACGRDAAAVRTLDAPPPRPQSPQSAVQPALGAPLRFTVAVHDNAVRVWHETIWYGEATRQQVERAAAAPRPVVARSSRRPATRSTATGSGSCGGDLPPCSVMMCESGGSLTIVNHSAIRPAGKWQITTSTWGGYGGYSTADQAPESVQDARARQIYNGGSGRGQWECR